MEMQTAERAFLLRWPRRSQQKAIARADHSIREGAYLDALRDLRAESLGSSARSVLEQLQTGLRQIFVSDAVTVAAARGLSWPPERIVSMSSPSPENPDDVELLLSWLREAAPGAEVQKTPADVLRGMAADALRRGDVRWAATLYEETLKKVVPVVRVHDGTYLRGAAPPAIGVAQGAHNADPARIRRHMANGDYAQAIALATQHYKATGNVTRLAEAHAAFSEVAASEHVLKHAAIELGRPEADVLPLQLCRAAACGEDGRYWQQWLARALPSWAGADREPVDALLGCARARLSAGSNINAITATLPRSPSGGWRSRLIEAEAARTAEESRWAEQLLSEISEGAPHVTAAHRRLGALAYAAGRGREAAGHFERAMLSPNSGEQTADQGELRPCRMMTLRENVDVYCLRGKMFIVRRDARLVGIKVFAGHPYIIRRTLGFRQARRIASILRLSRFRGPPPERQWLLNRMPATTVRSGTFRNRAGRNIARWTPPLLRARLSPVVRFVHWRVLSPCKQFAIKGAMRGVDGAAYLLRLLELAALRFWVKAEPAEFLDGDDVQSVFDAAKGAAGRPHRKRR
jgi:hypothetical protein